MWVPEFSTSNSELGTLGFGDLSHYGPCRLPSPVLIFTSFPLGSREKVSWGSSSSRSKYSGPSSELLRPDNWGTLFCTSMTWWSLRRSLINWETNHGSSLRVVSLSGVGCTTGKLLENSRSGELYLPVVFLTVKKLLMKVVLSVYFY